jgi:hypothetical protein
LGLFDTGNAAQRERLTMDNGTSGKRTAERTGNSTGTGKPGWFGLQFGHDKANRELRVCMTRAVAGVSVAGFCGLLIGVVAVARNSSNNGPQTARASIIEPAAEEGLPKVMPAPRPARVKPAQVHTSAKPLATVTSPVKAPVAAAPAAVLPSAKRGATPTTSVTPDNWNKDFAGPVATATAPATAPEGRTAGRNYLVFGSFPTMNEARRTSQKLKSDGVSCTIERGLPGWTMKSWYSVVGVKGYETTTKNPAFQADLKSMENLGLEPRAYRWRGTKA